ncbi:unnamed protein product [Amoebophrya sp. A120]|nr:unnamed protein product [Amoebophrya sp. A120]|eukprot:GSA120T00007026001.1
MLSRGGAIYDPHVDKKTLLDVATTAKTRKNQERQRQGDAEMRTYGSSTGVVSTSLGTGSESVSSHTSSSQGTPSAADTDSAGAVTTPQAKILSLRVASNTGVVIARVRNLQANTSAATTRSSSSTSITRNNKVRCCLSRRRLRTSFVGSEENPGCEESEAGMEFTNLQFRTTYRQTPLVKDTSYTVTCLHLKQRKTHGASVSDVVIYELPKEVETSSGRGRGEMNSAVDSTSNLPDSTGGSKNTDAMKKTSHGASSDMKMNVDESTTSRQESGSSSASARSRRERKNKIKHPVEKDAARTSQDGEAHGETAAGAPLHAPEEHEHTDGTVTASTTSSVFFTQYLPWLFLGVFAYLVCYKGNVAKMLFVKLGLADSDDEIEMTNFSATSSRRSESKNRYDSRRWGSYQPPNATIGHRYD